MKLVFKFTATIVDEIEKTKGVAIENCVSDNTINNLALLISKSLVNDNGSVGTTRAVALSKIDEYLQDKEYDKDNLLLDIVEALVNDGFLSRTLEVSKMRGVMEKRQSMLNDQLENI